MKLFERIKDFNKRLEKIEKFVDGADSVRAVVSDAIEDADLDYALDKHSDRLDDLESAWDKLDDRIDDYIRDNCDFMSRYDVEREVEGQISEYDFSDDIDDRLNCMDWDAILENYLSGNKEELKDAIDERISEFDFGDKCDLLNKKIDALEKQNAYLTKMVTLLVETKKHELLEELNND